MRLPSTDKIHREDILAHAYREAKSNQGAPGVDGRSFEQIESEGLEEWLLGLREELRDETYRPQPVRRVKIPKPGGGERPLGIPTIRDRVVQTAAKLILEPIWEADLEPRPMVSDRNGARKTRFGKFIDCSVKATPTWWTPTCRSTSIRFRTPS